MKVSNIMACNKNWLLKYYYAPLNAINRMISEQKRYYPNPPKYIDTETPINSNVINNAPLTPIIVQEFRNKPVSTICIFCRRPIQTRTELKFNCLACFCFLLTNILYICVQVCSDKNICCCDVIHRCPNCGKILGEFNSC